MQPNQPLDSSKHLPALDGLRGLAVLLVLFHHASPATPEQAGLFELVFFEARHVGWAGVDIFFVLSGFLITGILYEAKQKTQYFRNFYGRRVLRIFPIYYLLLAAVIVGQLIREPGNPPLRGGQVWYWLYLQNFKMADWGDFGVSSLGVTWSLAIEEQFYLIWPAIVYLSSRRMLVRICLAAIVGTFVLRIVLLHSGVQPNTLYLITPTRLDGLAVGALIAILLRRQFDHTQVLRRARGAFWFGLLACGVIFTVVGGPKWNDPLVVMFGYSAIAVGSGGLLVQTVLAPHHAALHRFFASGPMVFFGKYSYAIYLFHPLVIKGMRKVLGLSGDQIPVLWGSHLAGQLAFDVVLVLGSIATALVSWHLVEKHCLRLKKYFRSTSAITRTDISLQQNSHK